MKEQQVVNIIRILSRSQGFYGRLLESLMEAKKNDPDAYHGFLKQFKDCKDEVEVILMIEA